MLYSTVAGLKASGRRATKRGNVAGGALQTLLATALDAVASAANEYAAAGTAPTWWPSRQAPPAAAPPPPAPPKPTCWEILGLDPAGATPDRVRDVQRRLAGIYHSDLGTGRAGEAKLVEVNAAASDCLAELRRRK